MINLKKLFKRKKGQGALEYLFMIAAALIIIFVVVRYISSSGQQATSQSDIASLQSQAELLKSSFQAKGWWSNNTKVYYSGSGTTLTLYLPNNKTSTYTIPDQYQDDLTKTINNESITTLYDNCQLGNYTACVVFGVLGGSST